AGGDPGRHGRRALCRVAIEPAADAGLAQAQPLAHAAEGLSLDRGNARDRRFRRRGSLGPRALRRRRTLLRADRPRLRDRQSPGHRPRSVPEQRRRELGRVLINWRLVAIAGQCPLHPRKRTLAARSRHVRFVPEADIGLVYSITSSARTSSVGGTSRPIALAVLRLRNIWRLVGNSTGKLPGLEPFKILSTKIAARR